MNFQVGHLAFDPGLGQTSASFKAVALQPDGKIVAAGQIVEADGTQLGALVRYNADGSLDTSYGSHGLTLFGGAGIQFFVRDLAIGTDGKAVVVGYVQYNATTTRALIERFDTNGSPDGTAFPDPSGDQETQDYLGAVTIQSDGKIVATGYTNQGVGVVRRYNPDGSIDAAFGLGTTPGQATYPSFGRF